MKKFKIKRKVFCHELLINIITKSEALELLGDNEFVKGYYKGQEIQIIRIDREILIELFIEDEPQDGMFEYLGYG